MSNDLISFLGWTLLPDFITTNLQSFYYRLTIRAGDPIPQPGTQRHALHRQRIYIAVIAIYLLYTVYEADWQVRRDGDFYAQLGVGHNVEEKALQSRFRRLTLQFHPDKIPHSATAQDRAHLEQRYVQLQLAKDTLVDPAKRFAYDRFGPDVTGWEHCKTIKDFVYTGVRAQIPFYVASAGFMVIMGWLGFGDWGKYWRYLALALLATIELDTITRPTFAPLTLLPTLPYTFLPSPSEAISFPLSLLPRSILTLISPRAPYLPFQALRVAHRITIALFIALNRLGPLLASSLSASSTANRGSAGPVSGTADPTGPSVAGDTSEAALLSALNSMERTIQVSINEAARLLALELVPFREEEREAARDGDDDGEGERAAVRRQAPVAAWARGVKTPYLREKLKEWFVTNTIRNDKEVASAVENVLRRRRGETDRADDGDGSEH